MNACRQTYTVWKREVRSLLVTPTAYLVLTLFLFLSGFFFFTYLGNFNRTLNEYLATPLADPSAMNLNQWVVELYYHTLIMSFVFLIPVLTMRLFPEERQSGMFDLFLTMPLSPRALVLGKYLGIVTVVLVMVGLSFCFPLLLYVLGSPKPELLPMLSGITAVTLAALSFSAIGLAASTLSSNQVLAGIGTMIFLLVLYFLLTPAESVGGISEYVLLHISPGWQVKEMIEGVLSLKTVVYFFSLIVLGLTIAEETVRLARWR